MRMAPNGNEQNWIMYKDRGHMPLQSPGCVVNMRGEPVQYMDY